MESFAFTYKSNSIDTEILQKCSNSNGKAWIKKQNVLLLKLSRVAKALNGFGVCVTPFRRKNGTQSVWSIFSVADYRSSIGGIFTNRKSKIWEMASLHQKKELITTDRYLIAGKSVMFTLRQAFTKRGKFTRYCWHSNIFPKECRWTFECLFRRL